MREIWKDIDGYENLYKISNLGNVKRIKKNGDYILKPKYDNRKYCRVILSKEGITRTFLVHRLVALAFIDNPLKKPYINHKNEITYDNRVENLEWCTNSENLKYKDCLKNGKRNSEGKKVFQLSLKGDWIATYRSLADASEITNLSRETIRACCCHRCKTCGGYKWSYKLI